MNRLCFAGLELAWDCGDLPFDPIAPALPLALEHAQLNGDAAPRAPDLSVKAVLARGRMPLPSPAERGAVPVLFHGSTRCFQTADGLVLWDGASTIRISSDGRRIEADVHAASLERPVHFSAVTLTMALLLALRSHGCFHLHAAAARLPGHETWVMPGESGAGKSTLALALLGAGAAWLSDDALLLRSSAHAVEVLGWARMIHMTSRSAAAFPTLSALLARCPEGSARDFEVDPRQAFSGRGLGSARAPFTLLFPRIGPHVDTRVVALERAEAFGRILHACAWVAAEQLAGGQAQLALLGQLVDEARAFEVALGTRLLSEPSAVVAELSECLR